MNKLGTLILLLAVVTMPAAALADPYDGPPKKRKAHPSALAKEFSEKLAVHSAAFNGDGRHAGASTRAEGGVRGLGNGTVTVSASWDWGLYSDEHPCAVVEVTPRSFGSSNLPSGAFDTTATITFERRNGKDSAVAAIRGGSVCEIASSTGPLGTCTVNEAFFTFELTGAGTGNWQQRRGSGTMRSVLDGCKLSPFQIPPVEVPADAVLVDDIYTRITQR